MDIALEVFGYIGTILVVSSMIMTSLKKLRLLNIIGSIISCIYAIIYKTWPIAIMNGCLIIINVIQLLREYFIKKNFKCEFIDYNNNSLLSFIKNKKINIILNSTDQIYVCIIKNKIIGFFVGNITNNTYSINFKFLLSQYDKNYLNKLINDSFKKEEINQLNIKI